jgi:hypothetical protein
MRLLRVEESTRPDKKLQAVFSDGGGLKTVHFGARGYGDFIEYSKRSRALGDAKRAAYIARHGATETWTRPDTAATLSRYILWEKPSLGAAISAFRAKFHV